MRLRRPGGELMGGAIPAEMIKDALDKIGVAASELADANKEHAFAVNTLHSQAEVLHTAKQKYNTAMIAFEDLLGIGDL